MKVTPLHDAHNAAGARMVEFAGYSMPVHYQGVIAEAQAVRKGCGMFDVSHMARLTLTGERVLEYLEWTTTNDVAKLGDRQGQYSLLPNGAGGLVDDIIVYRMTGSEYRLVVNASNHDKDVAHLREHNQHGVAMEDTTAETAMLAVQGPRAVGLLGELSGKGDVLAEAPTFGVLELQIADVPCFAARSGYTGEDGYELVCPAAEAVALWDALLAAGVTPCGLGSRDTLRVEAGLPLYGHELSDDISPIAAGLGWVVSKTKSFLGSEQATRDRQNGTETKLYGLRMASKRIPQPGMEVKVGGESVGTVTSGVYSPALECGIGFAYLRSGLKMGTGAELDFRGKSEEALIVGKRFLRA